MNPQEQVINQMAGGQGQEPTPAPQANPQDQLEQTCMQVVEALEQASQKYGDPQLAQLAQQLEGQLNGGEQPPAEPASAPTAE